MTKEEYSEKQYDEYIKHLRYLCEAFDYPDPENEEVIEDAFIKGFEAGCDYYRKQVLEL